MKTHGLTGVPQTPGVSEVHSFFADASEHPCCLHTVPSEPLALQNCTTEQPAAGVIRSLSELAVVEGSLAVSEGVVALSSTPQPHKAIASAVMQDTAIVRTIDFSFACSRMESRS
jgi:hypothetical protein